MEGFRRLNAFKAHSDKRAALSAIEPQCLFRLVRIGTSPQVDALTALIHELEAVSFGRTAPANQHKGTILRRVGGSRQGSATAFPHTNRTYDTSSNRSHSTEAARTLQGSRLVTPTMSKSSTRAVCPIAAISALPLAGSRSATKRLTESRSRRPTVQLLPGQPAICHTLIYHRRSAVSTIAWTAPANPAVRQRSDARGHEPPWYCIGSAQHQMINRGRHRRARRTRTWPVRKCQPKGSR